jgi:hypothetical protein
MKWADVPEEHRAVVLASLRHMRDAASRGMSGGIGGQTVENVAAMEAVRKRARAMTVALHAAIELLGIAGSKAAPAGEGAGKP